MISGCGGNGSNLNPAAAGDRPPAQYSDDTGELPGESNDITPPAPLDPVLYTEDPVIEVINGNVDAEIDVKNDPLAYEQSLVKMLRIVPEEAKQSTTIEGFPSIDLMETERILGYFTTGDDSVSGSIAITCTNPKTLVSAFNTFMQTAKNAGTEFSSMMNELDIEALSDRAVLNISSTESSASKGNVTSSGKRLRIFIKSCLYGIMALNTSLQILTGTTRPIINFTVDETPAPVFYNFIVPDNNAAALAAALPLPSGFTLQKIRILESDPTEVIISDTTPFADFIDSVPKHILVFMDKIEFVISPCYNLNEL
jgi:hypothetical protein